MKNVTVFLRPNPCLLHQIGMTCNWEWKAIRFWK